MVLDHIGIAVRSIDKGIEQWRTLFGYRQATEVVVNTRQKVKVVFMEREGALPVKLIEPVDAASPAAAAVARGGGLHHVCFRCDNLSAELERLGAAGCRVLSPPQPGEAFDNEPIAFLYANQGLNIELIDTTRRAARINET